MAEAVLVRWIEHSATSAVSSEVFRSRLHGQEPAFAGSEFARHRAGEWPAFFRVREGQAPPDVGTMSDWLQRRVAADSEFSEVLAALAAGGRTRRVRTRATERFRRHREDEEDVAVRGFREPPA